MMPANGDTAGSSSSQDDPAATVKKRNRPQCNLSSDKEAVFYISFSTWILVIWGLGCLLRKQIVGAYLLLQRNYMTWYAADQKTTSLSKISESWFIKLCFKEIILKAEVDYTNLSDGVILVVYKFETSTYYVYDPILLIWRSSVYSATASSLQAYTCASDSKFDCLSIHRTSFSVLS